MSLLFQRPNPQEFVVSWNGKAGHYLNADLRLFAERFPPRSPSAHDDICRDSHRNARHEVPKQAASKSIQREQRLARGLCIDCPRYLGTDDGRFLRCEECRAKVTSATTKRYFALKQAGGYPSRCARCKRKARAYGAWCRTCARAAGVVFT